VMAWRMQRAWTWLAMVRYIYPKSWPLAIACANDGGSSLRHDAFVASL
jgi:hypothetical protein